MTARPAVVWTAVSPPDLRRIAAAGWRSWPADIEFRASPDRADAVRVATGAIVPVHGAAHVLRVEAAQSLACAIMEDAEYRGPISDIEIATVESHLDAAIPEAWRQYLQRSSWFRRGWLASGAYVWLYSAAESLETIRAWGASARAHPGILIIGGDGGGAMLTMDLREQQPRVLLTDNVSPGWADSIVQCSLGDFIGQLDRGSFDFSFGPIERP